MRLTGGRACWRERGHSYRSISSYRKLPPPACPGTTCSDATNQVAPQAQFRPRAFEKCTALRQINFEKAEYDPTNLTRCLPECCFLEAGIVSPYLPSDFTWIGPAACEHCARLQLVDLSRTEISEILGSTFAHCSQLQQLSLAKKLRRIGREAFLKCTSLREVHPPPSVAVHCSTSICRTHATLQIP